MRLFASFHMVLFRLLAELILLKVASLKGNGGVTILG